MPYLLASSFPLELHLIRYSIPFHTCYPLLFPLALNFPSIQLDEETQ